MYTIFVFLMFSAACFASEYKAVDSLKLENYIGKWYQVYGDNFNRLFQSDGSCSTAKYEIIDDNKVSVYNSQYDKNNNIDSIKGFAYYKEGDCCGYLTVKLADNPEAPYWVLELGPIVDILYDYAIVSDNNALSLFVLTRNVENFYKLYNETVVDSLNNFGFTKKYNYPVTMDQTNCD